MRLFDEKNLDVSALESLGIYMLRDIGRKIGVKLPTTLKKAELIRQIKAIHSGEQEPYTQQTKKGRPPKTLESIDSVVEGYFEKKEESSEFNDYSTFEFIGVCEDDYKENSYVTAYGDDVILKGIFDVVKDGGVIVDVLNKIVLVCLDNFEIEKYGLKQGDFVECVAKFQEKNKPYKLVKVVSVNYGQPNRQTVDFALQKATQKNKLLSFVAGGDYNSIENNVLGCMFGDRIITTAKQRSQIDNCLINLLNCNKDSARIVTLLVDCTDEQSENYEKIDKNVVFMSKCGDYFSNHLLTTRLACKHALRLCEQNEGDVILAIPNINALINALTYDKMAVYETVRKLKKLFMQAKNTAGGSLTVVFGVLNDSDIYSKIIGCENALLVLHDNLVTPSIKFKYNILLSQRNDENNSEVRNYVYDYLAKNKNSYESIKFIDSLIFECGNVDEFIQRLKKEI